MGIVFFINSTFLGIALAIDAFSVSVANGLNEPTMKKNKMLAIASTFSFFQAIMPILGYICVHTIVEKFNVFNKFIPYIALLLLSFLGIKMIVDSTKNKGCEECKNEVTFFGLIVQGIATSIDALSVGFTIANHSVTEALICALIIAFITFFICVLGVFIGKKFGNRFSNKAEIFGGIILICIGIEIFLSNVL